MALVIRSVYSVQLCSKDCNSPQICGAANYSLAIPALQIDTQQRERRVSAIKSAVSEIRGRFIFLAGVSGRCFCLCFDHMVVWTPTALVRDQILGLLLPFVLLCRCSIVPGCFGSWFGNCIDALFRRVSMSEDGHLTGQRGPTRCRNSALSIQSAVYCLCVLMSETNYARSYASREA